MKSSKVISLVMLVGMASQAHGMFGRLGSAFTTRGLVAATAAAGLSKVALAEGDKPQQIQLRLGTKKVYDRDCGGSWWNPFSWRYKEADALLVIENDRDDLLTRVPYIYKTHHALIHGKEHETQDLYHPCSLCSDEPHSYPHFPFGKCVADGRNPLRCAQIDAEQEKYKEAAKAMVAQVKGTEKRKFASRPVDEMGDADSYPEHGIIFRNAKKRAGISGLDDALLERYFYTKLEPAANDAAQLHREVAARVNIALRQDREKAKERTRAEGCWTRRTYPHIVRAREELLANLLAIFA